MSVFRIASRYAKSILDLGIEQNQVDNLFEDMKVLKDNLKVRDLKMLVKSPIIKANTKERIFKTIFGDKVSEMTILFFNILARKGRETYLPEIVDSFIDQYKKYKKITEVTLTTAQPISESALASIQQALSSSDVTEDTVEITSAVDESLIGGFVIELGDKLYDASVAHKIEQVKKQFLDI